MNILAIDPGFTVGMALVEVDSVQRNRGKTLETWEVEGVNFEQEFSRIDPRKFKIIVVEKGPQWVSHERLSDQIRKIIEESGKPIVEVMPGHWKGHPSNRKKPEAMGKTKHERDAENMGHWYIRTHYRT